MQLTPRETEVLAMLKTGRKTSECAAELGITLGTWKVYASRVYQKTGTRSRVQLVARESPQKEKFSRTITVSCQEQFREPDYTFS